MIFHLRLIVLLLFTLVSQSDVHAQKKKNTASNHCQCGNWTLDMDITNMSRSTSLKKSLILPYEKTKNKAGNPFHILKPFGVNNGDVILVRISNVMLNCNCTNGAICDYIEPNQGAQDWGAVIDLGENDLSTYGTKEAGTNSYTGGGNSTRIQQIPADVVNKTIVMVPNPDELMQFRLKINALAHLDKDFKIAPFQYIELKAYCSGNKGSDCQSTYCSKKIKLEFPWLKPQMKR